MFSKARILATLLLTAVVGGPGSPRAGGQPPPKPVPPILFKADEPAVWSWQIKDYVLEDKAVFNPKTGRVVWKVQSVKCYDALSKTRARHEFGRYGPYFVAFEDEDGVDVAVGRVGFQGPLLFAGGQAHFLAYLELAELESPKLGDAVKARIYAQED